MEFLCPIRSSFENTFQCLWNTLDFSVQRIVDGVRITGLLSKNDDAHAAATLPTG
jgi:hypothetical protein